MPWHLSKSDPRKVYDERHEPVCVCQTPEQAARIVAIVTGKPQEVIRLKEPGQQANCEVLTDSFEPDQGCCTSAITSASRKGVLKSLQSWECPRCGCEWRAQNAGVFRHWSPIAMLAIIQGAR